MKARFGHVIRIFSNTALLLLWVAVGGVSSAATKTWDGGTGFWDEDFWNGGGAPPVLEAPDYDDAVILSGDVTYETFGAGDFAIHNGSSVTVGSGIGSSAVWNNSDPEWSEVDGELIIDGGTFNRTGGGAFLFGSWLGVPNETASLTIKNNGTLVQRGEMWLSYWENAPDNLTVNITVESGTLDVAPAAPGGIPNDNASIFFINAENHPDQAFTTAPTFNLNFTGDSGTMIVGANGIVNPQYDPVDEWFFPPLSYQDIWDLGFLQKNGLSGLTGHSLNQFFTVTGTVDAADYTLSVGSSAGPGDFDYDGDVDGADFLVWQSELGDADNLTLWEDNFGDSPLLSAAGFSAVPEPNTIAIVSVLSLMACCCIRKRK
jgi:hypothetical protein